MKKATPTVWGIPVLLICVLIFMGGLQIGIWIPGLIDPKFDWGGLYRLAILFVLLVWLVVCPLFAYGLHKAFTERESEDHSIRTES